MEGNTSWSIASLVFGSLCWADCDAGGEPVQGAKFWVERFNSRKGLDTVACIENHVSRASLQWMRSGREHLHRRRNRSFLWWLIISRAGQQRLRSLTGTPSPVESLVLSLVIDRRVAGGSGRLVLPSWEVVCETLWGGGNGIYWTVRVLAQLGLSASVRLPAKGLAAHWSSIRSVIMFSLELRYTIYINLLGWVL